MVRPERHFRPIQSCYRALFERPASDSFYPSCQAIQYQTIVGEIAGFLLQCSRYGSWVYQSKQWTKWLQKWQAQSRNEAKLCRSDAVRFTLHVLDHTDLVLHVCLLHNTICKGCDSELSRGILQVYLDAIVFRIHGGVTTRISNYLIPLYVYPHNVEDGEWIHLHICLNNSSYKPGTDFTWKYC